MFSHEYWGIDYFEVNYWGDASVSSGGSGGQGKLIEQMKITEIILEN